MHEIDGLDENDPKLPLLRSLGLDQDLTFVDVGEFYEVRSPLLGAPFVMPHGIAAARAATAARFPQHAASIDIYFDRLCRRARKRLKDLREAGALMAHETGERLPPYIFVDYSRIDSGLNESKPYLGSLCGIDRYDNWAGLGADEKRMRKQRWTDRLIADLDTHCPNIAAAIVHREMATAETMQRYLNTPGGAVYGFAP